MGFFSDLKEDLSQAVNELMPDELNDKTVEEVATKEAEEIINAEAASAELQEEITDDLSVELSLEEMLKNIDDIQLPEDYETQAEDVEPMDASLEEALAAALESIPDENGEILSDTASWMYAESAEEVTESETEVTEIEEPEAVPVTEEVGGPLVSEAEAVEITNEPEDVVSVMPDNEVDDEGADDKMDSYTNRQASDETAVITAGMQIKGDITSEGSVDVVGTVEGNIEVWGKLNITGRVNGNSNAAEIYAEGAKITGEIVSSGAVKIGNSSVIIGNITAKSAAIAGAVKGDIDVQGPVILDASAIVMGNIKSKSVQINNGAVIEGMCSQCYADVSPLSFFDEYKTEIKNSKKNK